MAFRRPVPPCAALALVCALAGCPTKPDHPLTAPTPPATSPTTAPSTLASVAPVNAGSIITGTLTVPAGIVATSAGNIISGNGGAIISTNGGGIVASGAGNRRTLQALKIEVVAGAKVYLADAAGNAIPGLPAVTTDANGKYTIPNVPPNFTFVVAAEARTKAGKTATFQTLTRSTSLGITADITPATALVAAEVVQGLKNGDLGSFNPATFRTATEATDRTLTDDQLPDFTDRAQVVAKIEALAANVAELKTSLTQVKTELANAQQTITDLQAAIAQLQHQATSPAPTPTAPPTATPTPVTRETPPPVSPQPPATTGCSSPAPHYFHPQFADGSALPRVPRLVGYDAAGTKLFDNAVDAASGLANVQVPSGCPLRLVLQNDATVVASTSFQVDPGVQDSATRPIYLSFPAQGATATATPTPAPATTCHTQSVRVRVTSTTPGIVKRVVVTAADGSTYGGAVADDGTLTFDAPVGCGAFDANAYDANGRPLGAIRLSIDNADNPPAFNFPY